MFCATCEAIYKSLLEQALRTEPDISWLSVR
jgi:hypothetical protein